MSGLAAGLRGWVFLGALLLFLVEPQIGRLVTTGWGGAAYVWPTCLMFFQGAVFLGYLYCHMALPKLGRWHVGLLAAALLVLPVSLSPGRVAGGPWELLAELTLRAGLPLIALSTTAVAAQRWAATARDGGAANPYPLYAVSNAGALLGLVLYPVFVEPALGLTLQRWVWALIFAVYALWGGAIVWRLDPARQRGALRPDTPTASALGAPWFARSLPSSTELGVLVLAAAPSALLVAVTTLASRNLGSVPYVWVAPLAVYLLSFVMGFSERFRAPWLLRRFWLEIAALGLYFVVANDTGVSASAVHVVVLFVVSLTAHRQIYRLRPPAARLTRFYLLIALGGWMGSAAATFAAPVLFDGIGEYPLAVLLVAGVLAVTRRDVLRDLLRRESKLLMAASAIVMVLVAHQSLQAPAADNVILAERNAFGAYVVRESDGVRAISHEGVVHGMQFVDPPRRRIPLSYYSAAGPLGEVVRTLERPARFGAVGMGAGTLATYLEPGEEVRFYEVDPFVVELAQRHFTYLSESPGGWEAIVGDARIQMERWTDDNGTYGLVLIDAFAGGAVPTHLLTTEALRVYRAKLAPGGVLLFHVTSKAYDLRAVLAANARALGWHGAYRSHTPQRGWATDPSAYVALAPEGGVLAPLRAAGWEAVDGASTPVVAPWTDDKASAAPVIRWSVFADLLAWGDG